MEQDQSEAIAATSESTMINDGGDNEVSEDQVHQETSPQYIGSQARADENYGISFDELEKLLERAEKVSNKKAQPLIKECRERLIKLAGLINERLIAFEQQSSIRSIEQGAPESTISYPPQVITSTSYDHLEGYQTVHVQSVPVGQGITLQYPEMIVSHQNVETRKNNDNDLTHQEAEAASPKSKSPRSRQPKPTEVIDPPPSTGGRRGPKPKYPKLDLYKCEHPGCEYQSKKRKLLVLHERVHSDEKRYKCQEPGCGKAYRKLQTLKDHMNEHSGVKPYECTICSKTFRARPLLQLHMYSHKKHRVCQYENCNYRCSLNQHMENHIKKEHMSPDQLPESLQCKYPNCGRQFRDKYKFAQHQQRHEGIKMYHCPVKDCTKSFVMKDNLKDHLWSHSTIKRYSCSLCNHVANARTTMKRHMESVHHVKDENALKTLIRCPEKPEIEDPLEHTLDRLFADTSSIAVKISVDQSSDPVTYIMMTADGSTHHIEHHPHASIDESGVATIQMDGEQIATVLSSSEVDQPSEQLHYIAEALETDESNGEEQEEEEIPETSTGRITRGQARKQIANDTHYACSICGASFNRLSQAKAHLKKGHQRTEDTLIVAPDDAS